MCKCKIFVKLKLTLDAVLRKCFTETLTGNTDSFFIFLLLALYIYDASNGSGMSVLHDAVQNNHIKVAKLLLQKGGE